MLSYEDNELLTRVGPGTPMGSRQRTLVTSLLQDIADFLETGRLTGYRGRAAARLEQRDRAVISLLYDSGLRTDEVVSLTWKAVRRDAPSEPPYIVVVAGKGQAGPEGRAKRAFITTRTFDELERLRALTRREGRGADTDWVFTSVSHVGLWSDDINRIVHRVFPDHKEYHAHLFRALGGTMVHRASGLDSTFVWGRWAKQDTPSRYYIAPDWPALSRDLEDIFTLRRELPETGEAQMNLMRRVIGEPIEARLDEITKVLRRLAEGREPPPRGGAGGPTGGLPVSPREPPRGGGGGTVAEPRPPEDPATRALIDTFSDPKVSETVREGWVRFGGVVRLYWRRLIVLVILVTWPVWGYTCAGIIARG